MKFTNMYVEGQWITITKNGQGTAPSDVGLVCRIAKIYEEGKSPARYKHYTIEIDRDKEGNRDRYLAITVIRHATPEEIQKNEAIINNYAIY